MQSTIVSPETIVTLALNRHDRTFTERDRTLLNILRPHLFQAYCNAQPAHSLPELLFAWIRYQLENPLNPTYPLQIEQEAQRLIIRLMS